MRNDGIQGGQTERLAAFIKSARSGKPVKLSVRLYTSMVKQVVQSESTDDIQDASDINLLMADFLPASTGTERVSKVYAISALNEVEVNAKTTRYVANERLKMDYARLKEAGVQFEEKFF